MSESIPLDPCTIYYNGIFDWESVYKFIRQWFSEKKFEFDEKKFKYKLDSPTTYENEVDFIAYRDVDEYIRYKLNVSFRLLNSKEIDVIKDGKKKKMVSARTEMKFTGAVILDYSGRWEGSSFFLSMRKFYHNYIIKRDWQLFHWDPLYYEMLSLITTVKQKIGMETGVCAY